MEPVTCSAEWGSNDDEKKTDIQAFLLEQTEYYIKIEFIVCPEFGWKCLKCLTLSSNK